jgi:hypothetical protein
MNEIDKQYNEHLSTIGFIKSAEELESFLEKYPYLKTDDVARQLIVVKRAHFIRQG